MLYISELCKDCAVANEIDYEIDDAWTNIHGTHDNGPCDHPWQRTMWSRRVTSDFNSVLPWKGRVNLMPKLQALLLYICGLE